MTRIGLISDTHGWLDEQVFTYFEECDAIWHAGDFGSLEVLEALAKFRPLRGVYGNIDGQNIRQHFPERSRFQIEDATICMQHIGGYPGRYAPGVKAWLTDRKPTIFVSGHSHILKAQFDQQLNCLHLNPGAAGRHGWQQVRTIMRFTIDGAKPKDLEVIELGKRGG
ncbi:MAG TPA: metallophosphoesterase family protein [Phnomibacter sp.]|nr:metallophosphoesterase family protein [Phnomibacter sp.]